jgi:hypothetical protein
MRPFASIFFLVSLVELLVSSSMIEHCWNTLSNRYLNCNENCLLFFFALSNRYADGHAVGIALPQKLLVDDTWPLCADGQTVSVAHKVSRRHSPSGVRDDDTWTGWADGLAIGIGP